MDVVGFRRGRSENSPDRAKLCMQQQERVKIKPTIKKIQIVYYLTRNGQLEHPHYMEVTHFANQPLRLKDVMERLTVLRGKGMPFMYSWSCKRSYKNGYVWNDLAENDIIYPADGAEFVLKGSELLDASPLSTERVQQTHVSNKQVIHDPTNFNSRSKQLALCRRGNRETTEITKYEQFYEDDDVADCAQEEEYYEDEEIKTSYTSSSTEPHSHCSRGISTDKLGEEQPTHKISTTESSTHSDSPSLITQNPNNNNTTSKRIEDGDPDSTTPGRNSVLLQLIACGGNLAVSKAKNVDNNYNKNVVIIKKSSNNDLHKGVLCKSAMSRKVEEEEMMISCMSENPRFGNFQAEEKEYFSGSIVESMSQEDRVEAQPVLKKSNSYNEERSNKAGLGMEIIEAEAEEDHHDKKKKKKKEKGVKGKCIPRKKSSKQNKKATQL